MNQENAGRCFECWGGLETESINTAIATALIEMVQILWVMQNISRNIEQGGYVCTVLDRFINFIQCVKNA